MSNSIEQAIAALKNKKMIILTDDDDREHEGDLVFPADIITPEVVNFMIRQGTGIVCVALPEEHLKRLDLPLMVSPENNHTKNTTSFTLPVDAAEGITTGVSAADRAKTIQVMMDEHSAPSDLVKPGHVYPLRAKEGGVLTRAGHTEGSIDIVELAGFKRAAVICEVMNPDGTMARGEALKAFAAQHDLPMLSIRELIEYRLAHEDQIQESVETPIVLKEHGEFTLTVLREKHLAFQHMTLFKPPAHPEQPLLVRIHSACSTGDIFGSSYCDCHAQLHHALERISEEGGLLIYLDQEGRGIGLFNKIKAYALQQQGVDTVEANEQLGLPVDPRSYYIPAQILKHRGVNAIRLLTNNPKKISGLINYGFSGVSQEKMPIFVTPHNERYLTTKKEKLDHTITF